MYRISFMGSRKFPSTGVPYSETSRSVIVSILARQRFAFRGGLLRSKRMVNVLMKLGFLTHDFLQRLPHNGRPPGNNAFHISFLRLASTRPASAKSPSPRFPPHLLIDCRSCLAYRVLTGRRQTLIRRFAEYSSQRCQRSVSCWRSWGWEGARSFFSQRSWERSNSSQRSWSSQAETSFQSPTRMARLPS